jgi:hypothetical protein
MNQKKVLLVQYYTVSSPDTTYQRKRQAEVDHCFLKNIQNPQLDEIHVLTEQHHDFAFVPDTSKIKQTIIGKRLTYKDAFDYYNEHLTNTICILANADIYTDESLEILDHLNFNNTVLAMNRYENDHDAKPALLQGLELNCNTVVIPPYTPMTWSQDAWIWKAPSIHVPESDFQLGITGCDNYIVYLMMNAGLIVYNPSHLLSINHYDRMSISVSANGKRKGAVSEKRETRAKTPDYYIYIDNLDDICDKYTESVKYVEMYEYRAAVSLAFKKSVSPLSFIATASSWLKQNKPTNSPFGSAGYWAPSDKDKQPYLECLFDKHQSVKIIDIRGRPVDKDNLDYGYVSKFKVSYLAEDGWAHDATEYNGLTTKNGNLMKRAYVDIACKGVRIYPLAFVGTPALKVRIFGLLSK